MEPPFKHRKIKQNKTMFKDNKDDKSCKEIMKAIDEALLSYNELDIAQSIVQEMSEFSTGKLIKCKADKCIGLIHYLHSDNYYEYECDNEDCSKVSHVFDCKLEHCNYIYYDGNTKEIPSSIGVCSLALVCNVTYCEQHCHKNGLMYKCNGFCQKLFCIQCKNVGDKCMECGAFQCGTCWPNNEDDDEDDDEYVALNYHCARTFFCVSCCTLLSASPEF